MFISIDCKYFDETKFLKKVYQLSYGISDTQRFWQHMIENKLIIQYISIIDKIYVITDLRQTVKLQISFLFVKKNKIKQESYALIKFNWDA